MTCQVFFGSHPSLYLFLSWRIRIKHSGDFAIKLTLLGDINKAHCWLQREQRENPFITLPHFKQSKTSEHQRFKAFHERKSGLNYKCSTKGRAARENVCRKLKYQPSIIWCNIVKTRYNQFLTGTTNKDFVGGCKKRARPWLPGCNLMVFARAQWRGRALTHHLITRSRRPMACGQWHRRREHST